MPIEDYEPWLRLYLDELGGFREGDPPDPKLVEEGYLIPITLPGEPLCSGCVLSNKGRTFLNRVNALRLSTFS